MGILFGRERLIGVSAPSCAEAFGDARERYCSIPEESQAALHAIIRADLAAISIGASFCGTEWGPDHCAAKNTSPNAPPKISPGASLVMLGNYISRVGEVGISHQNYIDMAKTAFLALQFYIGCASVEFGILRRATSAALEYYSTAAKISPRTELAASVYYPKTYTV